MYETWAVASCARCGGEHNRVRFKRLARPVVVDGHERYQRWGLCPMTGDPILMHVAADDGESCTESEGHVRRRD
jgi:hypothetical protein